MTINKDIKNIANTLKMKLPFFECPDIGQTPAEIINTLKIVKRQNPKIILEIGSGTGGFLYLLSALLIRSNTTFITVDSWTEGTKYEKQYDTYLSTIDKLKKFYSKNQYIHIRGKSEDKRVISRLKEILKNNKIDFLFIDGNHTYQSVLSDWGNYRGFMSKNSIVAFHDIIEYKDVNKAWKKNNFGK